jgi:hypothetical protein
MGKIQIPKIKIQAVPPEVVGERGPVDGLTRESG